MSAAAASNAMSIAVPFVAEQEGYSVHPYQDTANVWTIGYGTTLINGVRVSASTPSCSVAQADAWLAVDMAAAAAAVTKGVTLASATQHQLAALISFAYNEGVNALLGSTLLKLFNENNLTGCEVQFGEWVYDHDPATDRLVKVAGLVNRRNAELALFKTADCSSSPTITVPSPVILTLELGASGAAVSALQTVLKSAGIYHGTTDGDYGPVTKAAVAAYQGAHGLYVDGIAGPITLKALGLA